MDSFEQQQQQQNEKRKQEENEKEEARRAQDVYNLCATHTNLILVVTDFCNIIYYTYKFSNYNNNQQQRRWRRHQQEHK